MEVEPNNSNDSSEEYNTNNTNLSPSKMTDPAAVMKEELTETENNNVIWFRRCWQLQWRRGRDMVGGGREEADSHGGCAEKN